MLILVTITAAVLAFEEGRDDGPTPAAPAELSVLEVPSSEPGLLLAQPHLWLDADERVPQGEGDPAPAAGDGAVDEPGSPRPAPPPAAGPPATDVAALICSMAWPCHEALAVAWCESNHQPGAISPDGANVGLMQINLIHYRRVGAESRAAAVGPLLDAATNLRVAFAIWSDQGWAPWSCRP